MKNHIEILENWIGVSDKFFDDKYEKIMAHEGTKTNSEIIEYNDAMMVFQFLKTWRRKLKKMVGGKEMPARVLKKIENLPNLETARPNSLMRW